MNFLKKQLLLALSAVCLVSGTSFAADGRVLVEFNYTLRANLLYTTGLKPLSNAPQDVHSFKVYQVGSYCDIAIDAVKYTTEAAGTPKTPTVGTNGEYVIAEGHVFALQIDFQQHSWDQATCTLGARAAEEVTPPQQEVLLGAIDYQGGFAQHLELNIGQPVELRTFSVKIPSFCGAVDVEEAGTVSEGIFDRAAFSTTRGGQHYYAVAGGHQRTHLIQVTLNGPSNSQCNVPIYGTF